ncbi:hypothetical protein YH62_05205 [Rhizobium sp. LC145]|nr:hypothetical protein YH62_05205 [Rhizobium sp. LC145]
MTQVTAVLQQGLDRGEGVSSMVGKNLLKRIASFVFFNFMLFRRHDFSFAPKRVLLLGFSRERRRIAAPVF